MHCGKRLYWITSSAVESGHQADYEWLRYRLVESDRQWNVGVCIALEFDWHKLVPWNLSQSAHNSFIECGLTDYFSQLKHSGGNCREHMSTRAL